MDENFADAIKKIKELYNDTYDLIKKYGDYYVMTQRIWVTTDNIYRLHERRAHLIRDEVDKNH